MLFIDDIVLFYECKQIKLELWIVEKVEIEYIKMSKIAYIKHSFNIQKKNRGNNKDECT